jgi:2-dehydropantoate 2-reductase
MRIAIVGAGAVGCFLAARLSSAGHDPLLIGRDEQVAAINRDGLLVRDAHGGERRYRLRAAVALDERPDLALLTVKTQDVAAACQDIKPQVEGVPVVAMQNGVWGDRIAADVLGRDNVLGAVVMCATSYLQPGEISVQFDGWLIAGESFGAVRPRTHQVVAVLRGGLPTYMSRRLLRTRWSKLIYNLMNGLSAATGLPQPELVRRPGGAQLAVRTLQEGYRVARATGARLDHGLYGLSPSALRHDPNASLVALLQSTMTTMLAVAPEAAAERVLAVASRSRLNRIAIRGSTWQSIQRGKPSEIEYLNGEIVRLGRQLGMPTPYNERVVEMVHEAETARVFRSIEDLIPPEAARPARATPVGGSR